MSAMRLLRAGRIVLSVAPVLGMFGLMHWGMGGHDALPTPDTAYLPQMTRYPRIEAAFLRDQYRHYRHCRRVLQSASGRERPQARLQLLAAIHNYNDEAGDCGPAAFHVAHTPPYLPPP